LSAAHLREVESLIEICQNARDDAQSGHLTDLEQFDAQFDVSFERLCALGEIDGPPDHTFMVRRRLRDLERIRVQLANELKDLRRQMAHRLSGVSRGRKGLTAYRSTVGGNVRGALRGQG
jgi:hypothetical protein